MLLLPATAYSYPELLQDCSLAPLHFFTGCCTLLAARLTSCAQFMLHAAAQVGHINASCLIGLPSIQISADFLHYLFIIFIFTTTYCLLLFCCWAAAKRYCYCCALHYFRSSVNQALGKLGRVFCSIFSSLSHFLFNALRKVFSAPANWWQQKMLAT